MLAQSHDPITGAGDGTSLVQPTVKLGIALGSLLVCFLCFAQSARLYAHAVRFSAPVLYVRSEHISIDQCRIVSFTALMLELSALILMLC